MKKRGQSACIIAFVILYSLVEIGASALIKSGSLMYVNEPLYFYEKEPCEKICTKCDVIIEENVVEWTLENDSVDTLSDYMQYYIFKPGVFDDNKETVKEKKKDEKLISYEMDEKEMLYKIVWKESRNQGLDGMRRVCDVVLNRVDDPRFPNNIKDVILAPGQFTTASKLNSVVYDEETVKAVNMELSVLRENRLDSESIYFARSPHTKNNYKFGDHYFSH